MTILLPRYVAIAGPKAFTEHPQGRPEKHKKGEDANGMKNRNHRLRWYCLTARSNSSARPGVLAEQFVAFAARFSISRAEVCDQACESRGNIFRLRCSLPLLFFQRGC